MFCSLRPDDPVTGEDVSGFHGHKTIPTCPGALIGQLPDPDPMPTQMGIAFRAVNQLVSEGTGAVTSGKAHQRYREIGGDRTLRSFSTMLVDLADMRLIHRRIEAKGHGGRTSIITLGDRE